MSKQKVIVLAVRNQGLSVADAARRYGVSRRWVHELLRREATGGIAAVEPRSKRPLSNPRRTDDVVTARILALRQELQTAGLDAGPVTIAWHLERENLPAPSTSTIRRILHAAHLITPEPKKRPRTSLHRFEAHQPNETWQSDFTHWPLADGTDTEILNFLDDHSRYLLACTAYRPVTVIAVVTTFLTAAAEYGLPASTLTDNGMVYTTRLAGGKGGRNAFEHQLHTLGITQKNGSPSHPQTQGKIERFHQTLKKWLDGQPRAHTLEDLNEQLGKFRHIYNHERPHRALDRRTPATAYTATPKAEPVGARQGDHWRQRIDRVDRFGKLTLRHAGRLHHIGIGRAHAGKHILMLIHDTDVIISDTATATGEIIRELTIDPDRDYQSRQRKTPRS
ncbi:IS481 family transposase [Arthrobacter sp. FW305-BF8]|uniref:IS481 family transposase n=1 Tax=Arthrobacter sp. FW305-BF8 TaxID=2879617 RepID=UPI001EFF651D|nr:IS481 family transposase [Arthrobacter sp. FW305-BF8]UKA53104.1 IS481 family transposase [Arthrobacter sp. FW305-BF8]UKA53293.1 IS481 family transposase [Arthrobacter sp. FW305-BF8]UKA54413.1 IS481 family transposase [Arthrobacter sp. FW305-BF8]UKA55084.1 IS481 family transposase [Arthrobacter sp. FW305-BF8]